MAILAPQCAGMCCELAATQRNRCSSACAVRKPPGALDQRATHITINFPWGSLLGGLLAGDSMLPDRLAAVARPGAQLELRLNAGALAEAGWELTNGGKQARQALQEAGFRMRPVVAIGPRDLYACPTTWAKQLVYGRDPHGVYVEGRYWG